MNCNIATAHMAEEEEEGNVEKVGQEHRHQRAVGLASDHSPQSPRVVGAVGDYQVRSARAARSASLSTPGTRVLERAQP